MTFANADMAEYWTSATGPAWVSEQADMDRMLRPLGEAAMARLALVDGARAVDIGCGCGDTALALARAGARVLGVDVSETMLARARARVAEARLEDRVELRVDDAQTADLGADVDAVFSRFGVMFFADPVAAFANARRAMRPGARLAFVCWQGREHNPWLTAPIRAAAPLIEMQSPPEPNAPGPFGLADRDTTAAILRDAGFSEVDVDSLEGPLRLGDSIDAVADKFMVIGAVGNAIRAAGADAALRAAVRAALVDAMAPFETSHGVEAPSAAWIVTATAS